jgi:formate hydrogenlyase subunit 3/multisubunit Na+/H+ antiporter MnhD subunit
MTSSPGGLLLVLAVLVPFVGVLAGFALGGRKAQHVAMATIVAGFCISLAIAAESIRSGATITYLLGGWSPPLGIALRADGLSVVMMLAVAVVIVGIGVYARSGFATPPGVSESRAALTFWTLLLAIWGALNLVFVSGDLFTLYVALELLTFAAVPLVSLDGSAETLRAALRYLLYALLGSILYLLGAVLIYGAYGTLDMALLAEGVRADPATLTAAALMTAGLLAKTALVPLHLWLPPAHAGAPPAASAVLSGLVVKGSWFLIVRLWFDVLPGVVTAPAAQLLAGLGAAAILLGNVVALRQQRLKLLVAYSTLAQIGYLFLMFPLAFDAGVAALERGTALAGGMLQAISHAMAKAAMFMAAGLIYKALGHDRIAGFAGVGRALPLTVLTFAVAGLALMGLPPSGAFVAKKLLLDAAASSGQWWWDLVMQAGGLLTTSYVLLVLAHALAPAATPVRSQQPVSRVAEVAAFALALGSLLLGFATATVPALTGVLASALKPAEFVAVLVLVSGGVLLAAALAERLPTWCDGAAVRALRRTTVAPAMAFARLDDALRRWPVAGFSLLAIAIAFGVAMIAGR